MYKFSEYTKTEGEIDTERTCCAATCVFLYAIEAIRTRQKKCNQSSSGSDGTTIQMVWYLPTCTVGCYDVWKGAKTSYMYCLELFGQHNDRIYNQYTTIYDYVVYRLDILDFHHVEMYTPQIYFLLWIYQAFISPKNHPPFQQNRH